MFQEPFFSLNPSCISCEGFIFSDDAMTGDDDNNRIPMVRSTDSSHGFRMVYHGCLFEIVSSFSVRDSLQRFPWFFLEISSIEFERNRESLPSSYEILWEFLSCLYDDWIFSFSENGIEPFLDISFFCFEFMRIIEIEQHECIIFCDGEETSDRTWYDRREQLHNYLSFWFSHVAHHISPSFL